MNHKPSCDTSQKKKKKVKKKNIRLTMSQHFTNI